MENLQKPQLFSLRSGGAVVYPKSYKLMDQPRFEHQFAESTSSSSDDQDELQDPVVSDSESVVVGSNCQESDGLMRIDEGDKTHGIISKKFLGGLGALGLTTQITAIHKNDCLTFIKQAKLQSFHVFSKAMEKKCGGNANVKYAWYGASREEIDSIFSHGFVHSSNNEAYPHVICLSPDDYPLDCLQTAIPDMNGTRHLLLCRVILGRSEVVHPGSGQLYPSSEEFDTGVDNLLSPRKYIVWSANMNSYVFPEFVVSFRVNNNFRVSIRNSVPIKNPNSPWISFPSLISALSEYLPPHTVQLIKKYYSDHKERKITRRDLIQHVRELAGDDLLTAIIKSCKNKHNKGSTEISSASSQLN